MNTKGVNDPTVNKTQLLCKKTFSISGIGLLAWWVQNVMTLDST